MMSMQTAACHSPSSSCTPSSQQPHSSHVLKIQLLLQARDSGLEVSDPPKFICQGIARTDVLTSWAGRDRRDTPGIEYLEKSGSVWEKETVLLPLGLDIPLAMGEEDTFPLMVA